MSGDVVPIDALTRRLIETEIDAKFDELMRKRRAVYRRDGLDEMHRIATMKLTDSASMAQVKYQACMFLIGSSDADGNSKTPELASLLVELDAAFKAKAPRIKSIRRETVTFETQESDPGRLIESLPE